MKNRKANTEQKRRNSNLIFPRCPLTPIPGLGHCKLGGEWVATSKFESEILAKLEDQ